MDKQAREAKEQMKALTPKEKWTNFWYYYKMHVIAALFICFLVGMTVTECMKRIDYDLNISYYSSAPIDDEGIKALTELMKNSVKDVDGNGTNDVGIASCFANPNEKSEQAQAVFVKLSAEVAAGESMVYMVDDTFREIMVRGDYAEGMESIIEIDGIPEVKKALKLADGQKLFWMTKSVYESEKNKAKKVAEHENAVSVEKMFIEKGAVKIK